MGIVLTLVVVEVIVVVAVVDIVLVVVAVCVVGVVVVVMVVLVLVVVRVVVVVALMVVVVVVVSLLTELAFGYRRIPMLREGSGPPLPPARNMTNSNGFDESPSPNQITCDGPVTVLRQGIPSAALNTGLLVSCTHVSALKL